MEDSDQDFGDLLRVIENIQALIQWDAAGEAGTFWVLFTIIAWFIGVIMVLMSIRKASRRQELGTTAGSWSEPLWMFVIGVMFVALPALIRALSLSLFGGTPTDGQSIFQYADSTLGAVDSGEARTIIIGIVYIVQFVGLVAVMRGLYMLNLSAQGASSGGPRTFGPGFTFLIAGAAALNFPIFVGMMESLIVGTD